MHCKACASLLDLKNTQNETRWGLASVLSVLCGHCQTLNDIYTGKVNETAEGKIVFDVNIKASVNVLLFGAGGEHVINFLAVLNVPLPTPGDTSIMIPPSFNCPWSLKTTATSPSKKDAPSSVTSSAFSSHPPREATPSHKAACDGNARTDAGFGQLVVCMDRIKTEKNEQSGSEPRNNEKTCSPNVGGEYEQKNACGKKRDEQKGGSGTGTGKKRAEQKSGGCGLKKRKAELTDDARPNMTAGPGAETEQEEQKVQVHFDDVPEEKETGFAAQKAVPRKYYRCPLCGRVLPSSRGFHIHVGRKHQASNLQAVHHELGPEELAAAEKEQKSAGKDASSSQSSNSVHTNPTSEKNHLNMVSSSSSPSARPDISGTQPAEGEGHSDTTAAGEDGLDGSVASKTEHHEMSGGVDDDDDREPQTSCRIYNCNRTFKTESLYRKHLLKAHGLKGAPFTCRQCGKQYSSQKSLNIHATVAHSTKDERKAVCKYCGDTVAHRRALKRHIKAQHPRGSKMTYYCDECPMTFPQPGALKTHKLRHAGVKNYQCFYCDKRFSGSGNRLNHMRYFHERERKFLCDTCGAGFYRAYALREHERIHSGEKPYQCERCAERFTKKEYLNIHMRTHTGERPYKCELCGKAFTQRTSRSLHRRKVHGLQKQESQVTKTQKKEIIVNNKVIFVNA
ncbi:uncharacterized protein LOC143291614 [Babylonia areolata]|uniref:uncharacterized protein LOC143291614 n=1 Tax=Babylonia areolata TaxID=304850 RepID=UPI003FD05952